MNEFRLRPDVLLNRLGVRRPSDIDLEAIAFHFGARVEYRSLEGCAARIIGVDERAIITIDENSPEHRRRFSLGHELGHWLWDRGTFALMCKQTDLGETRQRGDTREARANRFAAELLMPRMLFREEARGRPITFDTVRYLSGVFRTSLMATSIRAVELGSYPAMVVLTGGRGRLWYWSGEDVPRYLQPRMVPGRDTSAHRIITGDFVATGAMEVDADEWFDHPDAESHVVMEDSVRSHGGSVLSLIWWKDESMLQL